MAVPSGLENRLFRNQTDQLFSEAPTEGHSKTTESAKLAEDRKKLETERVPCGADPECQLPVKTESKHSSQENHS